MNDNLPRTKIEIDVAHYMKNWAHSLNNEKKHIKKFYLFAIGQLILCKSNKDADKVIRSLVLIALSETAGNGATSLQQSLGFIKKLLEEPSKKNCDMEEIVEKTFNSENLDISENEDEKQMQTDVMDDNSLKQTILETWAFKIKFEVNNILKLEKGDDFNPRYCPIFASRLLNQIKTLPLWSCVRHEAFGYGRVPPSSAPVESEFKVIKNHVVTSPMRIDMAVEQIKIYYDRKVKLIESSMETKENEPNAEAMMVKQPVSSTLKEEDIKNMDISSFSFDLHDVEKSLKGELLDNVNFSDIGSISPLKNNNNNNISTDTEQPCISNPTKSQDKCTFCDAKISSAYHILAHAEDEKKYNAKLCTDCFNSSKKDERMIYNMIENWRNKGKPSTKKERA